MLLTGLWCASAQALSLHSIGSFEEPVYVTSAPNNPDQLFVVERPGRIIEVENGTRTVFADLRSLIDDTGEGGLLSIALSPDFQTSGRLYVYYTGKEETPAEIHVDRNDRRRRHGPALEPAEHAAPSPTRTTPTTTGGSCSSVPKAGFTSQPATAAAKTTSRKTPRTSSSPLGKILRVKPGSEDGIVYDTLDGNPFLDTPGAFPRSGATACATPSASPSTA